MIAIPAIDLRDGACVQLVGGDFAAERVRRPDPMEVAREWEEAGFAALHVVDLDAAMGRGSNGDAIAQLTRAVSIPVQVGGGVRDEASIDRVLSLGAARVIVGTRALQEPEWLEQVARERPGRLVVAVDVRGRAVLTHGWTRTLSVMLDEVLERLTALPLGGVLVTAVHNEGRMTGPDVELTRDVARRVPHDVYASGGIAGLPDLRLLAGANAAGAVIGMALYTGAIDAKEAAREFGAAQSRT